MSNFRPKTTNPRIFFHLCQCDGRIIFPFASRCKGLGPLLALYVWAVGFWFDFDFEIVADADAVDSGLLINLLTEASSLVSTASV